MRYDEFVNRPLVLYSRVEHQAETVRRLETICMSTTIELGERVQTSRQNTQEKKYAALADAQKKLNGLISDLLASCEEVRAFLYENLSHEDADLLEWRYIGEKSLMEIAEIQGLSYQTVKNRISEAERKARGKYYGEQ